MSRWWTTARVHPRRLTRRLGTGVTIRHADPWSTALKQVEADVAPVTLMRALRRHGRANTVRRAAVASTALLGAAGGIVAGTVELIRHLH